MHGDKAIAPIGSLDGQLHVGVAIFAVTYRHDARLADFRRVELVARLGDLAQTDIGDARRHEVLHGQGDYVPTIIQAHAGE